MQVLDLGAREAILSSIREHLAASVLHDAVRAEKHVADRRRTMAGEEHPGVEAQLLPQNLATRTLGEQKDTTHSLLEIFKANLEAVGGHCIVAPSEAEVVDALNGIVAGLRKTSLSARRIALSNAPLVEHLARQITVDTDEILVAPSSADLFEYDVGITTAQAAIAETGTLVLESECERHRLISLVPPVHIAIVDRQRICLTLGEALAAVHRSEAFALSPTITLSPARHAPPTSS